ncbi:hypothetical protein ESB00_01050 [Oleiharenicola lentus]|uniref:PIN domain-containing protein n=1 Tax=Oleiharenicola lentus TaxID=2508720 RepID=A0A4Q1C6K6_9BACT|nr:PIN domain-containing protein [Oleiharenicola lentus]RXK54517.1 hypothetical protein ESB00_01050 [Oleiharenicola lentus]
MADGVLLDTSFLISFVDSGQPDHPVAVEYFQHFVSEGVPMFLSTIVASEFGLKQSPADLLQLGAFIVLPFNLGDAMAAAELDFTRFKGSAPRVVLKDDFKVLGQAAANDVQYIITGDKGLHAICSDLRKERKLRTWSICMSDGFSHSHFDASKQTTFEDLKS